MKGYTLGQLSLYSGIPKSTIRRIENWEMDPTQSQMRRISKALNRHVLEVFDLSWI
ncbi:helix-turn-helix domain-containing protein [Diplocloster agilis]|uniref:helix-turn-helix domain-containing protein n=1 Tax=Diplocloster agilis TaxID=2850323 RepID=UPI003A7F542F